MALDEVVDSEGVRLRAHVARPAPSAATRAQPGVVVCHGYPRADAGATAAAHTFPELADRIAADTGWPTLAFAFRGCDGSEGNFSLAGWLADVRACIDYLHTEESVQGVWLVGFGTGGSIALCVAAEDDRVRGVAGMAARADFTAWAGDARRLLEHSRQIGAVRNQAFPPDIEGWARPFREVRPLEAIAQLPPRPVLLVQGTDDDEVPQHDARALTDAAHGRVDLRILPAAGHDLRHDPRAIAVLLGWLNRQGNEATPATAGGD